MTPQALRDTLTQLGWSTTHLARVLGVGAKTPTNWVLGRAKMPQDLAQWLERYARWCRIGLHNQPVPGRKG